MSAKTTLTCDAPDCVSVVSTASTPFTGWSPRDLFRFRAKQKGWTQTRVPDPFHVDGSHSAKTVVLHRCPEHRDVLLRVVRVDDVTYRIILKPDPDQETAP